MAFTMNEIQTVRTRLEKRFGFRFPEELTITQGSGLRVTWEDGRGSIQAEDKTALARGFFLLHQAMTKDEPAALCQQRHFRSCGAFVDCSRGAVMTVEACKAYVDHIAALGMNVLALYMEDTYEVKEYPYFGYLRGRYTQEELREIDEYCAGYDIELLPCIQTLAHLEQFLQWDSSYALTDTDSCLLIGSEETYRFIEAAIASLRGAVRTKRLHVGMDEAHDVGLGRYLQQHGPVDRFALLNEHLTRVCEICRKYDFEPMMWSDMFFRLGSPTGDYYDPDNHVPEEVIQRLPQVGMVYWDYYHKDEATYEHMLSEHLRMERPVIFAGGNWTWSGFLPHVKRTDATMYPAMKVAVRHGIDTVLATMWGDDGNETDAFLALSQLPIFSEACWLGEAMTQERVHTMAEALTGLPTAVYEALGEFNASSDGQYTGKSIVYADLLLPMFTSRTDLPAAAVRSEQALKVIMAHSERPECRYAEVLFRLVEAKSRLIPTIRAAYTTGDRETMRMLAEQRIPEIITLVEALETVHRERWERYHKRAGWEIFPLRYGSLIGRMKDVQRVLLQWADGTVESVSELATEPLPGYRWNVGYRYHAMTNPKSIRSL